MATMTPAQKAAKTRQKNKDREEAMKREVWALAKRLCELRSKLSDKSVKQLHDEFEDAASAAIQDGKEIEDWPSGCLDQGDILDGFRTAFTTY